MSTRFSLTMSTECLTALKKLAQQEHRSASNTAAAILERAFSELRQEGQATGAVQSLKKKISRRDDVEIEDMEL